MTVTVKFQKKPTEIEILINYQPLTLKDNLKSLKVNKY